MSLLLGPVVCILAFALLWADVFPPARLAES